MTASPPGKRLPWVILGCAVLFVVAAGTLLVFYDEPRPDDSDLLVSYSPVPLEENAIVVLSKIRGTVKLKYKDYPELADRLSEVEFEKVLKDGFADPGIVKLIVERNAGPTALLRQAMAKPRMQYGPRYEEMPGYQTELLGDPLGVINLARIYGLQLRAAASAERQQLLNEGFALLDFSSRLAYADGVDAMGILTYLAIHHQVISAIIDSAKQVEDRDEALAIARRLSQYAIPDAMIENAIKGEYETVNTIIEAKDYWKAYQKSVLPSRYQYKPNATRRLVIESTRSALAAVEKHDLRMLQQSDHKVENPIRSKSYMPNSAGWDLSHNLYIGFSGMYRRLLVLNDRLQMAVCTHAMRAYWLDHGTLPESLEMLVPMYLEAVPAEPVQFGGKPIQYNSKRRVLYSVGENITLDDGEYAFHADADPVDRRPFVILDWAVK